MILINLLPHREAARKRRRELFLFQLLLALLAGLLLAGAVALSYQARIDAQRDRNDLFLAEHQPATHLLRIGLVGVFRDPG